jgi:hypothetical protein
MALGDVIARLSVSLDMNTSAFEKGSKRAQAQTESLGKKMTRIAGAIGTAFVASIGVDTVRSLVEMGKAAVDTVGALGEQAQQLGVTTDALQEFRFVASQTGIEQAEIDKSLQRLTRTIGELEKPTKAQAAAMQALGLSTDSLKGLGADKALVVLSEAFNKLPDAATRSAVGFDLMGRSFQTLLPLLNEGPERINAMVKAAHDLGIVLTPEQIANADKYADQIEALNASADAQKAAALARYGEGLAKLTRDYTQFQIDLVHAFVAIDKAGTDLSHTLRQFGANTAQVFRDVQHVIENTVSKIAGTIGGTLRAVWDHAIAKIGKLGDAFRWLYDVVVGHSYIPDMVAGIASEMARLDAVMVKPVTAATTKAEEAFRDMASNVQGILDRLFPEMRRVLDFRADRAALEGSDLSDANKQAALGALFGEGAVRPDFGSDGGPLVEGMRATEDAIQRLTEKAKIGTVRIADSFAQMAEKTMASITRLSGAIRSGDFLGILEAVIGTGLQLGSAGVFGKGFAARVNAVPGYANGTNFHRGGLAMVGERGPELVSMPRGSRVTPNHAMGGMEVRVVPSPYFDVVVDGRAARVAGPMAQMASTSGSIGAQTALARRGARRFP